MSWLIGAGINLVGSVMINLGTNVMKLGHNKRAMLAVPEAEKPPVTRFREWQIGTAVFITGNVANFVSFGYAAQSLLAALGSVQFVSNVFFASFVLKEKVTIYVIVATCCIIGGCLLLVAFGNHSSDDYTVDQLLALYRVPAYIIYLVMMFVFVLGSYILYLHGKHVSGQKGREGSAWVSILPVSYSIFSALLGTQSVLFSKSLSVLLRTTFQGDSQLGNWYTWVTLVCFLISAGFWVTRLNKGLHMFPAMIIVPLMQICWTLFSIISGMIYFQEYVAFNPSTAKHGPLNAIMFTIGVLIVFAGVFLLTKGANRQQRSDEEAEEKAQQDQLEMVNNPAYQSDDGTGPKGTPTAPAPIPDVDVPQRDKISMDTLRFTSLAASTPHKGTRKLGMNATTSPSRALGHGDSPRRYDRDGQDGGSPMHSHGGRDDMGGTSSMMGTLKKGAKKLQHRIKSDFSVDPDNFKQIFGMGPAGYMPALSVYSMNTDLTASRRQRDGHKGHNVSITHALPSSRFYGGKDPDIEGGVLQESKSEDLDRASEPLIHGGPSSASDMLRSLGSLPSSFTRQGLSQGRMGGPLGSGHSASGAPDPGTLRELMSKTMKQMEDLSSRARSSVEASLNRYRDQKTGTAQYGPLDPAPGQLDSIIEVQAPADPLGIPPHPVHTPPVPEPGVGMVPIAETVVVSGDLNTLLVRQAGPL